MSEEFIGQRIINDVAHTFQEDEIAYCNQQQVSLEEVREALGKLPATSIAEGMTLDALIGEAVSDRQRKAEGKTEPNVIDPTDPKNEGPKNDA